MEICVRSQSNTVEIWLTKTDVQDVDVRRQMQNLYRQYRGCTVAVFRSGEEGLYDNIKALLSYNRKQMAEAEVRREKRVLH